MAKRKSVLGWLSYANMACIKSVIDARNYFNHGTVDTWFCGWRPAVEYPVATCVNVILDAGSVIGLLLIIKQAVEERRKASA